MAFTPLIPGDAGLRVAIIGSGFSGLGMGKKLKEAGFTDFTIFERADDVGGTWRDNTYPGAACDVPSFLYSFSFAQNPDWSRAFSAQGEILAYLRRCVDDFGLRPHLRFRENIVQVVYDEDRQLWILTNDRGEAHEAEVLVSATGGLSNPLLPDIPGRDRFRGAAFHTARWDHGLDLRGKRVAVIGTGASAVQVIPSIAPQVARLDVYQRTPGWVLPRADRAVTDRERWWFRNVPGAMSLYRQLIYWGEEILAIALLWDGPLTDLLEHFGRKNLEEGIKDPQLRARLTPSYRLGCKRMLLASDYYPTFERENVELITDPISEIRETGIVSGHGALREVDVIIYATGFDVPLNHSPLDVRGLGGVSLSDVWAEGAQAYKGLMVHGFPNLFFLMGPNTGPGHTSVLVYIESQLDFVVQALGAMGRLRLGAVDVRAPVQRAFNDRLAAKMAGTVWTSGCKSWYLAADGTNAALWPGFSWQYRLAAALFRLSDVDTWPQARRA